MDETDRMKTNTALNDALEYNQQTTWKNPHTGIRYVVTPKTITYHGNSHCRKYQMTSFINGERHVMSGIACRQSDGTWVTVG